LTNLQVKEYGNKYYQLLWLLFGLGASSSIKYTNMHAFMHKKMTKYLYTIKSTKYFVVKKNKRVKLLRTYIALINRKIYNMHKCTKKWLTSKYVLKKSVTLNYFILFDKYLGYGFKCL
jgi:hypothetical protein